LSLQKQLDELTARLHGLVPAERLVLIDRVIGELKASAAANALKAGDDAPQFELPDGDGLLWRSEEMLGRGPLCAVFYRGRWCAYCNTQLTALQEIHSQLATAGVSLVAISPQTTKHTYMTRDMHKLRFPVLSDHGNQVARQFGLVFRVPGALQELYERIFARLPGYNGEESWELPVPATYMIQPDGKISLARTNVDWRERPEPEEILREILKTS